MKGQSMYGYIVGYVLGGSLFAFEVGCVLACTVFRQHTAARFPRVYAHLARGVKTTSYRTCAAVDSMVLILIATGNPWTSTAVVSWELITKFGLYYVHETVWSTRPFRRFVDGSNQQTKG